MSFFPRERALAWLRAVAVATIAVYAVYLLAANIILRTSLLRGWLRADDGSLAVDYASARSLFPGTIVVHGLAIRFQDDNVQMGIGLDRVSVEVDLWKLAVHRTARFDHVRGEGLDYRLRLRMESLAGSEHRVAAFPPIAGFGDPPLAAAAPMSSSGKPWTIEIADLSSSVRQVWTMEYRFEGDATVEGGFHIEPRRQVYVTPSVMRARRGVLSLGTHEFIRGNDWTIDATLDPFVPAEPKGVAVLHYISYAVHQHGDVVSLAGPGEMYLPPGLVLDGGAGPIAIDVHVDHGIVQPDARITYRSDKVEFRAPGLGGTGDIDLVAHVAGEGAGPHIAAEATAHHASLSPATSFSALRSEIELGGVDTTAPIVVARLAGSVGSAKIADLRAWNAIAPATAHFDGGAITTHARGEYREGALTGRVDSSFENVAMTVAPFAFVASGKTSTDIVSSDVRRDLHLRGTRADLENVAMTLSGGHADHMWIRARAEDTKIATSGPTATDVDIAVTSGPGDQNVKLFTRMASIPDIAADITHGEALEAKVHLRVRHDDIGIGILTARNGILGARGNLHAPSGRGMAGALLVNVGPVNAGLDIRNGHVGIHPLASGEWLDETLAKR